MYDIRHLNRRALVFRNRAFGLLWFGQLLSGAGDWLLLVAVPVYVFQLTRSASDAGFALVADVTPRLLLGPVAGVYADRWPRGRVMIGADLLSAAAVGVMLLGCARAELWLLLAGVCAESACCTFFSPACTGLVPAVVGRDGDLASANGWFAVSGGFQRLAAAPLGGALYALGGFWLPATIDAASYLASALLVALITSTPSASARPRGERAIEAFGAELRHGLVSLVRNSTLRVLLTASSLFLFGNAALTALFVPYVLAGLHLRAGRIGELFSALGAGYLVSTVTGRAAGKSPRLRACACGLLGLATAAFAGFLAFRSFWAAAGFLALAGLAGGSFLQLQQTTMQRNAPDHLIGRISAAYSTITTAMTLSGALLAAIAVSWIGRTETMALAVTAIGGAAAAALFLPARRTSAGAEVTHRSGRRSIRGSGQRVRCGGRIPRSCGSEPTGARRAPGHPSTRPHDPASGPLPRRR